ncbi:hypothetical protein OG432_30310 [Streptomyces sp. NBC_00442]|uniref:DUF6907 domain-containing protein n=1 Tax=Streptomyces sp. NBC_00442 TaxID=2903651 RepID=UPI002E1FB130
MSAAGTVAVQTTDHGVVPVPEPSWCLGVHQATGFRSDVCHLGRTVAVKVQTRCHGEVVLVEACLVQYPYSTGSRAPYVTVDFVGDGHEYSDAGLRGLSERLVGFALETVPRLRAELAAAGEVR